MPNRQFKTMVEDLDEAKPEFNNNAFIIEVWKKMGLRDRMGGVAFSELKHFVLRSPDVETITRYRRG